MHFDVICQSVCFCFIKKCTFYREMFIMTRHIHKQGTVLKKHVLIDVLRLFGCQLLIKIKNRNDRTHLLKCVDCFNMSISYHTVTQVRTRNFLFEHLYYIICLKSNVIFIVLCDLWSFFPHFFYKKSQNDQILCKFYKYWLLFGLFIEVYRRLWTELSNFFKKSRFYF